VLLCWSEKAQLSGESRKVLKDSTVMNEASLTFVEYFAKRVESPLESKVDFYATITVNPTTRDREKNHQYLLRLAHENFKYSKIKHTTIDRLELVVKSIDFGTSF
jgi:hypothetical protein